jgi:hypothetical protein
MLARIGRRTETMAEIHQPPVRAGVKAEERWLGRRQGQPEVGWEVGCYLSRFECSRWLAGDEGREKIPVERWKGLGTDA